MSTFQGDGPFAAAVKAARMPMVVTDPTESGNPADYVNQSIIDLFGYSHEEVLGQNYFFLAGPDTDPEVERLRTAMMADEPLTFAMSTSQPRACRRIDRLPLVLRITDRNEAEAACFCSALHPA